MANMLRRALLLSLGPALYYDGGLGTKTAKLEFALTDTTRTQSPKSPTERLRVQPRIHSMKAKSR